MFVFNNPNPDGSRVGDCVVRALAIALDKDWDKTYIDLALQGLVMKNMPSSNAVWGNYLKTKDWERHAIPNTCPDCYSVDEFCQDHPKGIYILCTGEHTVTVIDGDYYDTWDSGMEVPVFYWTKGGVMDGDE